MRTQSQPICSLDLRPAALRGPRPSSDSGVRLSPPRPTRFHRPVGPGARLGFTLIEIIIALTLLSIVGAAAVTAFCAAGFAVGALFPSRFAAPLAAFGGFLALVMSSQAGSTHSRT